MKNKQKLVKIAMAHTSSAHSGKLTELSEEELALLKKQQLSQHSVPTKEEVNRAEVAQSSESEPSEEPPQPDSHNGEEIEQTQTEDSSSTMWLTLGAVSTAVALPSLAIVATQQEKTKLANNPSSPLMNSASDSPTLVPNTSLSSQGYSQNTSSSHHVVIPPATPPQAPTPTSPASPQEGSHNTHPANNAAMPAIPQQPPTPTSPASPQEGSQNTPPANNATTPATPKPTQLPKITFLSVTEDNRLTLSETQGQVHIIGEVQYAKDGDVVQLQIGDVQLQAVVFEQKFATNVDGRLLAQHNQIQSTLTTQDNHGNPVTKQTEHHYEVLPVYTTTITYPNNTIYIQDNQPFNLEKIRYTLENPQQRAVENPALKAKVIQLLNDYIANKQPETVEKIHQAFKQDSDYDGVIDLFDRNPQQWDVSERDLRFFATAAHSSKNMLRNLFERYNDNAITNFNRERLGGNADIQELNQHWELLKFGQVSEGLEYVIFGNGKRDERYDNVVVAFRGSNTLTDWLGNLSIPTGQKHPQLAYLEKVAQDVEQYQPHHLYATGYSLGGYLAQYFTSHTMQSTPERMQMIQRSSLFNPAILKINNHSPNDLKEARATTEEYLQTPWLDPNDLNHSSNLNRSNAYVIEGEFLSSGYILLPALGSYTQSHFFNGSGNAIERHKMIQFFANDTKLQATFSKGYRLDNHYVHQDSDNDGLTDQQEAKLGTYSNKADSDADGISDLVEIALNSNPTNSTELPQFLDFINVAEVFGSVSVNVKVQNSQGGTREKVLLLQPQLVHDTLVYSLDAQTIAENTTYFTV